MSLVDIEVDGTTFKSYLSLTNANSMIVESVWRTAQDAAKLAALVKATQFLDRLRWIGQPTVANQTNAWPRTGIDNVAIDEIPNDLKTATAILATRQLWNDAPSISDANVKLEKIGPKTIEYFSSKNETSLAKLVGGRDVLKLIRKWLNIAPYSTSVVYGGDTPSEFEDIDRYGVSSGLA